MFFVGRNEYVLSFKMLSIRNISAGAHMALVTKTEINESCMPKIYKLLQLVSLQIDQLRRGYSPWAFPYTLISCASKSKKRLNVMSLTFFPVACSHSALAVLILSLCLITADFIASVSEEAMRLGPRPPFSPSPSNPLSLYRFSQSYI